MSREAVLPQKKDIVEDVGGGGEGNAVTVKKKKTPRHDFGKRWHRFRVLTPTSWILRGSYAMGDLRFKYRSRGRQATPSSVVAIVYGRLFEPKDWIKEYVDQVLQYGDKVFRISMMRNHVRDDEYMKASLIFPEFYIGTYKVLICVEESGIFGNLFSETVGCSDFSEGLSQFFQNNDAGVVTAQGTSVAMWRHGDTGFLYFDPGSCDEKGLRGPNGVACLMRFKCLNEMRDAFMKNMNRRYDSRYCIDKVTVLRVIEIGRGYLEKVPSGGDLVVDKSVLRNINPVDIDENKMDCTKPVPKDEKSKILAAGKIHKEPLTITISNYSIDRKFATEPLVDQNSFDTGYTYDNMHVNVPSTFRDLQGNMAILHGLTHEGSEMYKGKGAQNVANCVMSIVMKKVHPVKTWMRPKLDEILALGDTLYADVKAEKPFIRSITAADLNDIKVDVDGRTLVINVDLITITGTLHSKVPSILPLKQALQEFFLVNQDGVIETPSMAVAIWTQDGCYYAFDPRVCDSNGNRVVEEKTKGGKAANDRNKVRKGMAKCCVIKFPDSDSLANWFLKNTDPMKKNDRFIIRHVTILDDIIGSRPWHDFEAGIPGEMWVLRGGISNDDETLEDASRGIQGLAMPVAALITAKEVPPDKWMKETIDEVIREGDSYYNWCNPQEIEETGEQPFLVSDLRKNLYTKNRKVKIDIDDYIVTGELNASPNDGTFNLEKGIRHFFENHQYGIVDLNNLSVAIWKVDEDIKSKDKDKTVIKETSYYCFDPYPRGRLDQTAPVADEEAVACLIRARDPKVVAKYIEKNAAQMPNPGNEFGIHNMKSISIGQPMTDEELEFDKQTPDKPDLNNYSAMGEDGAILQASFNQNNETIFKRQTRDKQQAASSIAALAMTKLYNPHLWYREVVDDVLKIGDKITIDNLANLPEPETEDDVPRNFLLPSELGEEFTVGVNHMTVGLEEENTSGRITEIESLLETFFENNAMGIFRQDDIMMPIWKEGDVFFLMDPKGRDSRGEPSERDSSAAVMWFTNIPALAASIQAVARDDFVIDVVTLENAYETRVAELERVKGTASSEDLWHNFPKMADGIWSIGGNVTMTNDKFQENNHNKQTAAIAIMAIVFSKVYEPRYWTSSIIDEIVITGDKLHTKSVERLGEDVSPRINQIIAEFFLSSRRIELTVKDCIEAGDLKAKPPKVQNLQSGIDSFFSKYVSGAITVRESQTVAIWKFNDFYYCLIPNWATMVEENQTVAPRVLRFIDRQTMVTHLLEHFGQEGDYEITAIDVLDWNKFPPWKFDPSPAVRPSNLPPLNAYRRLQGDARAILRGGYHQGDEIFPEILRNKQTAANCVVALGMAVVKTPITWTKKTMDEILAIGSSVHRETLKARPTKPRIKPHDIIRVFYVGVNILTADIESNTVTGIVAIPPPDPDDKKKKKKGVRRKAKAGGRKKGRGPTRIRAPPPPPILLEEGLGKFFENNRAGILVTDRGSVAIWKDMGVYFMYDPRARNDQGLPDFYGTSCAMWFACMEPFYDVILKNIDEQEKYGRFEICRVIIKTAMIEPLPCPAGFRPYFDCATPAIPVTKLKRPTTLAVETVTEYNVVDDELSVLRGTLHMNHRKFNVKSRGLQSTAIAAVAIVVGLLHVPSTWTPDLIDAILKYGDLLHSDSVRAYRPGARNLSPSELLTVFIVGDSRATIHIHNHTTAGLLHIFDVAESLAMFFRTNCSGILHTTNMAVAVMQHYGKFYLFDPCSRNNQGRPSFEGAACVMKCESIMKMASVFVTNCNLKRPNIYTLNAVNVLGLHFFSDAKSGCPPKCEQ